ncbi:hypothetical protein KEM54_006873 [Ascosphaera aggregata]|nr:hypothetical protein KEM54_006873 [Ascosphaera aggregata]
MHFRATLIAAALAALAPALVWADKKKDQGGQPDSNDFHGKAGTDSKEGRKPEGKTQEHNEMGSVNIKNSCGKPVYLWSIADSGDVKTEHIEDGGSYSEHFRQNANGGGISIKLSDDESGGKVSQFEYTLQGDDKVYYDWSNIDGYPFAAGGVKVNPSETTGDCPPVDCPAGVEHCDPVYNKPDDDFATHGCSNKVTFDVELCPGGKLKDGDKKDDEGGKDKGDQKDQGQQGGDKSQGGGDQKQQAKKVRHPHARSA